MQIVKMKCNYCGAQLELNLDDLQVYCPYCGQKLMMDLDQLAWVLAEKEKTKQSTEREKQKTTRVKMAYDYALLEKKGERKHNIIIEVIPWIVLIIIFVLLPALYFSSFGREHKQKVEYLQKLELEIDENIQAQDYDAALLKLNKLYLDDNYSSEESATWDAKREEYLKIIEGKRREVEIKDPINIFMPSDASYYKGKKYLDVVNQFVELGFTNISTQVASDSAGLFKWRDTVEHILVGGKTDFTSEDYFNKDVPIIIYYYSD